MVRCFTVHFSGYSENIAECMRRRSLPETNIINIEHYGQTLPGAWPTPRIIQRLRVYYHDTRPIEEQEND
jgi:hypothetical protein